MHQKEEVVYFNNLLSICSFYFYGKSHGILLPLWGLTLDNPVTLFQLKRTLLALSAPCTSYLLLTYKVTVACDVQLLEPLHTTLG